MFYVYNVLFTSNISVHVQITMLVSSSLHSRHRGIVNRVYLDIREAFDALDHPDLRRKLYAVCIRGNLYIWIKSYLTNRSQFVVYNNSKPETEFITHGVPQGSILGASIFYCVFERFF